VTEPHDRIRFTVKWLELELVDTRDQLRVRTKDPGGVYGAVERCLDRERIPLSLTRIVSTRPQATPARTVARG
jgi:hypothetical protein